MGGCEGGMREGRERLIYRARHTPFVCANNYSPPHTRTWSGAMNLVPPFIKVETS